MRAFVVVISGLLLSTNAFAQTTGATMTTGRSGVSHGQTDVPQSTNTVDDGQAENRRVCRRIEAGSGSRTAARRVCMTVREWAEQSRRD
jgi:hypothetical protein